MVDEVLKRNAVHILIDDFVITFPEIKSGDGRVAVLAIGLGIQSRYRSKTALCSTENVACGNVLGLNGKFIAAIVSPKAVQESGTVEKRDDLFEVFNGDGFPFGDVF